MKMKTKKIPISFNEKDQIDLAFISDMINLKGTYGEIPKTLKFSITLVRKYMETLEGTIPDLNEDELDTLLSSIKKMKLEKYKIQKLKDLEKEKDSIISDDEKV